jgi:hypothetical protein
MLRQANRPSHAVVVDAQIKAGAWVARENSKRAHCCILARVNPRFPPGSDRLPLFSA